jgi:hypothetical protein
LFRLLRFTFQSQIPKGKGQGILDGTPAQIKTAIAKIEGILGSKVNIISGAVSGGDSFIQERPQIDFNAPIVMPKKDLHRVQKYVFST